MKRRQSDRGLAFDQRTLLLLDRANVVSRMRRCVIGCCAIPRSRLLNSEFYRATPRTRKRAKRSTTLPVAYRTLRFGGNPRRLEERCTDICHRSRRREGRSPAPARARTNAHRQDSLETAGITRAPIACGATCTGIQSPYLSLPTLFIRPFA